MSQNTNPLSRTSQTGAVGAADTIVTTSSIPRSLSDTPGAGSPPTDVEALGARAREGASEITTQAKESAVGAVDDAIAGVKDQATTLLGRASEALGDARGAAHEALSDVRAAHEAPGGTQATGGGAPYGLVETIKVNPLPAVLVGLGLAWLFRQSRSAGGSSALDARAHEAMYREHRPASPAPTPTFGTHAGGGNLSAGHNLVGASHARAQTTPGNVAGQVGDLAGQAGEAVGNAVDQIGEAAGNVAGQVGETTGTIVAQVGETAGTLIGRVGSTAGDIASGTVETAGNIAEQAQYRAMRLEDRFQRALRESPLAVGAVTLALGTAIGLTLPQTARENQLMGEARDNLLERAQDFAQETVEKVQSVATEAEQAVAQTVKEEARGQGLTR